MPWLLGIDAPGCIVLATNIGKCICYCVHKILLLDENERAFEIEEEGRLRDLEDILNRP